MQDSYCGAPGEQLTILRADAVPSDCTWSLGSLHIPDWSEPSIPLQPLIVVDGALLLFRPLRLTDMRGFEHLRRVGGELSVSHDSNGELRTVAGLESLTEVGALTFRGNSGLRSLSGLSALETIHGTLRLEGNSNLPQAEIDALLAHVKVEGSSSTH